MKKDISIRPQQIKDAKRFFEILSNPNFIYFSANPKTIQEERDFLKQNAKKRKEKSEFNFTILHKGNPIGAVGISVQRRRPYIGEIGYFLDEAFWGKGIAQVAVSLLEEWAMKHTEISRIEILMKPENKASERVAIKSGYKKEGKMRKAVMDKSGKPCDVLLYAKIIR